MRRKLSLWVGLEIASSLTATSDFQLMTLFPISSDPSPQKSLQSLTHTSLPDELILNPFSSTLKEQISVQQNFCERESEGGGEENE